MFNVIAVAIDGPTGAGKSSVSKAVAKKLGFIHVDTGALYRAVAYKSIKNNLKIFDEYSVNNFLKELKIDLTFEDNTQKVWVNGEDVTGEIRTEEVSMMASNVSKIPSVRAFLLDLQRNIAKKNNVIMDGRDIATVILPNADVKIFFTASPEKRAERRYNELLAKNQKVEYNTILDDVIKRDKQDSERDIAPLKPAEDSIILDTSDFTFDESVQAVVNLIKEKISE